RVAGAADARAVRADHGDLRGVPWTVVGRRTARRLDRDLAGHLGRVRPSPGGVFEAAGGVRRPPGRPYVARAALAVRAIAGGGAATAGPLSHASRPHARPRRRPCLERAASARSGDRHDPADRLGRLAGVYRHRRSVLHDRAALVSRPPPAARAPTARALPRHAHRPRRRALSTVFAARRLPAVRPLADHHTRVAGELPADPRGLVEPPRAHHARRRRPRLPRAARLTT